MRAIDLALFKLAFDWLGLSLIHWTEIFCYAATIYFPAAALGVGHAPHHRADPKQIKCDIKYSMPSAPASAGPGLLLHIQRVFIA